MDDLAPSIRRPSRNDELHIYGVGWQEFSFFDDSASHGRTSERPNTIASNAASTVFEEEEEAAGRTIERPLPPPPPPPPAQLTPEYMHPHLHTQPYSSSDIPLRISNGMPDQFFLVGDSDDENSHLKRVYTTEHRSPKTMLLSWAFQIAACFLSLVSFICLLGVAIAFENKPLSDWKSSWFSISALVAALTTAMKGALMVPVADTISQAKWSWFSKTSAASRGRPLQDLERIDQASRGLWGSIQWLFQRPKSAYAVTVGAVLTVLVVAFDVFAQQFISIDTRLARDSTRSAHVPWVQKATRMDALPRLGAIYNGAFSAKVDDLPATCPSGNCTWGIVPSIGVCGACLDITSTMTSDWMTCSGDRCTYTSFTTLNDAPPPNRTFNQSLSQGHMSAPNSEYLNTIAIGPGDRRLLEMLGMNQTYEFDVFGARTIEIIEVPLLNYSWSPRYVVSFGQPTVTQCGLWYCLQAYETDVSQGKMTQTMKQGPYAHHTANSTDEMIFDYTPGFNMEGLNFSVSLGNMYIDLLDALNGTGRFDIRGGGAQNPPSVEAYLNNNNTNDRTDWIERVAKSVSNELRLQNQILTEHDDFQGTTFSEEAYIQVSWPWVVYPAVMLVTVVVFFVVNVIRTERLRVPVWVNGALALLLAGVDEEVREKAQGQRGDYRGLVRRLGEHEAFLEMDEKEGWTFKATKRFQID